MHVQSGTAADIPGLGALPPLPPDRPADRARREAAEKRLYIRRMAAMVLARQGLGLHLAALARAMQLPPSSLTYHYGTREDLLGELVSEHLRSLTEAVCAAFDASAHAPPAARLVALLLALLDAMAAEPHVHAIATHGALALAERDREELRLRWQVLLDTLAEPLLATSPALAARPKLAAALVQCVVGGCGDAQTWFLGLDGMDRPTQARRLAAMLLAGAGAERDGRGPAEGCGGPALACAQAWALGGAGDACQEDQADAG